LLYQACGIPDRSTVILGAGGADAPSCAEVALRLADAVRLAAGLVGPAPVRCIIACNSAHYFWPLVEADLRQTVQMVSLVDAAIEALGRRGCRRALLLATEGARAGQVFSAPLRDAGVAFEEPSPAQGRLLMRAIFEGLKSLDERRAVELANQLFEDVLGTGRDYDCVVAACTEVPLTIDLLRRRGSSAVAAFLSRVAIVDPLEEALCRA
jgi:aspartate racemase